MSLNIERITTLLSFIVITVLCGAAIGASGVSDSEDLKDISKADNRNELIKIAEADPSSVRNPFLPVKVKYSNRYSSSDIKKKSVRSPRLVLSGVMFIGKEGTAVVNGKIVSVGDTVSGAKVVEIKKDRVVFLRHGRKIVKRMTSAAGIKIMGGSM